MTRNAALTSQRQQGSDTAARLPIASVVQRCAALSLATLTTLALLGGMTQLAGLEAAAAGRAMQLADSCRAASAPAAEHRAAPCSGRA